MKISKSIFALLLMAIAFFSFSTILAQDTNARTLQPTAKHGGVVKEANGLNIELVPNSTGMLIYLMDAQGKPKGNKGITGSATISYEDKITKTETLKPANDDHFTVPVSAGKLYSVAIKLSENGKEHNATFSTSETAQASYICPMRCEGSASNKPGSCPKCGMALVPIAKQSKGGHEGHNH